MVELELQYAAALVVLAIFDGGLLALLIRQRAVAVVVLAILQRRLVGLVSSEKALLLREKGFFCSDISDRRLRDGYLCGQQETYRAARLLWPSLLMKQ